MGNDKASKKLKKVKCVNPESGLRQLDCRCPDCYPVESELLMARTEGRLDGAVFAADHMQAQLAAATERAEEFKRIGQQFERDSRKFFEQSCTNLQRAEKAEQAEVNIRLHLAQCDELMKIAGEQNVLFRSQRDAAIKAKEEAEAWKAEATVVLADNHEAAKTLGKLGESFSQTLLRVGAERDAEKKRADELAVELQKAECLATYWKELTKDPKRFETDYYKAAKALNDKLKAECEDLRKSLEELVRIGDRKTVEWDRAKEVLAAYSKAVKP